MFKIRVILVLLLSTMLGACATGAKIENMSTEPTSAEKRLVFDNDLNSQIGVSEVSGGKKTNPLWKSNVSSEAFQQAVVDSLSANGLYNQDGAYELNVELQKVKQPALGGFNMTVTTTVRYVLTDVSSAAIILDEVIIAPHTATMSDAFAGVKRLRLANEGSAKKNIEELITMLSKLKISGVAAQ